MRTHTSNFKNEISQLGRQINGRIYHYLNYNLATENSDKIITEDNIELISEQTNLNDKELIDEENIYQMNIIKNGQFLHSLMKEFDFEAKNEFRVGDIVNAQFGVLVGVAYEYLDYGNYIIYSKEYNAENQTWNYVCYDKMLYAMVQYKPLNLTYPCTIRQYITAVANRIGLTFANASDTFTNYNQQVQAELFEGQNIIYRDILDKLSEITASNILINDNDELELGYPNNTNDIIDENNLKDINVNFGEMFGPINKVAITESDGGYEYSSQIDESIETNGLTQINIVDNLFAFNDNSEQIAQNILNKIKGLSYSINDFSTTGVAYYDFLDMFDVSIEGNSYKCLLLNNEIKINQGLEETIYTEKYENSEKESNNFKVSDVDNKTVQFRINKQKKEIELKVSKDDVINSINLSEEGIQILASKLGLTATDVINIIAGSTLNLTAKDIEIDSTNFKVDKNGNCQANSFSSNNATITGGGLNMLAGDKDSGNSSIKVHNSNDTLITSLYNNGLEIAYNNDGNTGYFIANNNLGEFGFNPPSTNNSIGGYVDNNTAQFSVYLGSAYCNFNQTGAHPSSDIRCKDNIKNIEQKISLNIIKNLKPVEYTYKEQNKYHRGLIAQDVKKVLDENNIKDEIYDYDKEKDRYSLNYSEFIPDLINCIKYQQEQIETLQTKIEKLEKEVK